MKLIAIGNAIINLDMVSVLDIDQTARNVAVVHVHSNSNQPVIDIEIPSDVAQALMNLVPQNLRLMGRD